ncbi:cysteinyl-tRNA synthetase [Acetobacter nitrogenifigens DSM 23921 = NBRC 105050]|uniref:Cysteine--tRNA ligase n=1 Tax=Acetobacter nitrogenifigens DSM 23921 = NBRC 105050 TaxID=1120919 RepID=A0A511XEF4_9PROT|nr:cysteine--tRNA ligase [Acetobacter nitrogenifigens]GBQ88081.1 cysteinyl-tRNA synthetase [Acetobacter nitrogenifigens DSM 23921 = NBRC 105050]GEN61265.1 cysteine--tRNA ligase [Acetobacter nitrogenifigens DSM 23921 = NBRC 105050]
MTLPTPLQEATRPVLSLHDSQRRAVAPFTPLDPEHVRIYYCGPTVYDLPHVGNLRAMLTADILTRVLRRLYPRVTFVRNITDVDDKITARARDNGEDIAALTERTTAEFHADLSAMNMLPPDIEPRATHNIAEMQAMISRLIEYGHAYEAEGHVLFAVASFPSYGALSGRDPEELVAGARVEVAPYKRDAGDFVLWKPSTPDLPGWESPWGRGRPGWHIECSAMAHRYLGESFDIHGGGSDLLFPHHENERAQSLCCFPGGRFANYWLHNAMLLVDGEKMSKSLGNFLTIRDVLARGPVEALRLLLMSAQYRSVLNFTWSGLEESRKTLDRFYRALAGSPESPEDAERAPPAAFLAALCDDLNTPRAIAEMHALAGAALQGDTAAAADLRAAGRLIGLLEQEPDDWFRGEEGEGALSAATIEALIEERLAARKARDFARADGIRAELSEAGVILEDGPSGTTWRRGS